MSSWELPGPVTALGTVKHRQHFVAAATVCALRTWASGGSKSLTCVVSDGTGEVTLVFLGRTSVPGLRLGAKCVIEGTALGDGRRLVVWNPLYRIVSNGN